MHFKTEYYFNQAEIHRPFFISRIELGGQQINCFFTKYGYIIKNPVKRETNLYTNIHKTVKFLLLLRNKN